MRGSAFLLEIDAKIIHVLHAVQVRRKASPASMRRRRSSSSSRKLGLHQGRSEGRGSLRCEHALVHSPASQRRSNPPELAACIVPAPTGGRDVRRSH